MGKATLTLVALLSILALPTPRSQAQTLTVLHYFDGTDGAYPQAGLVMGQGGQSLRYHRIRRVCLRHVFKVDTTGKETVLHIFTDSDVAKEPYASALCAGGSRLDNRDNPIEFLLLANCSPVSIGF